MTLQNKLKYDSPDNTYHSHTQKRCKECNAPVHCTGAQVQKNRFISTSQKVLQGGS